MPSPPPVAHALQKPTRAARRITSPPERVRERAGSTCSPLCAPRGPHPALSPPVCQVIGVYDYSAQNDDELAFSKGQIINVLNKDDPDWWRGEVNGQVGLFPSNYVKLTADTDPSQQCKCPWPPRRLSPLVSPGHPCGTARIRLSFVCRAESQTIAAFTTVSLKTFCNARLDLVGLFFVFVLLFCFV